jgi:hypothetical protein
MEYLEREYKSVLIHLCMAYRTASGADIDMDLVKKKHGRVVIVYLHGRESGADEYINVEGDSPLYMIADVTKKMNDILR